MNNKILKDKAFLEDLAKSLLGEQYTLFSSKDLEEFDFYLKSINKSLQDDETLKSYFKSGCVPTENNFAELIKSKVSKGDVYLKGETFSKDEITDIITRLVFREIEVLKNNYIEDLTDFSRDRLQEIEQNVQLVVNENYSAIKNEIYKDTITLVESELEGIVNDLQGLIDRNTEEITFAEIDTIINRL